MRILIIGGTRFLGRGLVRSGQARRHQITLFNRGVSNPGLFPEVEHLTGDRTGDLQALEGRTWDVVIDTCGYEPAVVRRSADKLAGAVNRYVFVSSLSVYRDTSQPGIDEQAAVEQLPAGADETFSIEKYGALKALCEQAASDALPGKVLVIRPGLIVGEYDTTDRFTYWPWRVAQGGEVLAPGRADHLTQFIDVRDLADWTMRMVEENRTGVYNATGPRNPLAMGELLETCRRVSGSDARFTWLSEEFLLDNGVQPWSELPLWLPESDPTTRGFDQFSIRKALDAGLTFRALEDTIASTLAWASSRPSDYTWRAGLPAEREEALLKKAADSSSNMR